MHIVHKMSAPKAWNPFLGYSWCTTDSKRGIAWGVLVSPSMQGLLGVVQAQCVEEAIGCPRYIIGATGDGSRTLRDAPATPLPLCELIFLNEDVDIQAWLLANDGSHPLNLMVQESRAEVGEDGSQTPEPTNGTYPYSDPRVWDRSGQARDSIRVTQGEDDDEEEEHDDQKGRGFAMGEKSRLDWAELDDIDEEEYEEDQEDDKGDKDDEDDKDDKDDKDDEDDRGDEHEDDQVDNPRGRHREGSIVTADVSFYPSS